MPILLLACLAAGATGCTKPNPAVCCTTIEQCGAIGVSDLRPCSGTDVCVENKCLVSGSDGAIDAVFIDAVVDSRGVHVFDVAYPKEWKFSVENTISGYFLIINTGAEALSTETLQLKSLVDDSASTNILVTATPVADQIPPGSSAGALSNYSRQLLVSSGLVAEPQSNTTADFMTLGIQGGPGGNYDVHVNVVLGLGDIDIPINMTIHVVDDLTTWQNPIVGHRAPGFRN